MKFTLFSGVKTQCYIFALTLFFYVLFPLLVILFVIIHFIRGVVTVLKLIFRNDLGKMLSPQSSFIAVDNPYEGTPKWNLCVWLVYEGNVDTDNILETFNRQVVLRESEDGALADPELQQYFTQWLGFLFWKWEDNFCMSGHSRNIDSSNNNSIDLYTVIKNLTWAPFKDKTSPWEFVWVRNYKEWAGDGAESNSPKTVMIFRAHHGLCDGIVLLKLLMGHLSNISLNTTAKPNFVKRSGFARFARILKSPAVAPYQFIKMMVEANDRNDWHLCSETDLVRPFNNAISERIHLKYIKDIRDMHGVGYNAVVMAAIAGGIRRMMLNQGKIVPEVINAGLPIPLPNHPLTITNYWTSAFIQLPVGMSGSVQRLKKIEENLKKLKNSYAPALNHLAVSMCGAVMVGLVRKLNTNFLSTTTISNFPGPTFKRECFHGTKMYEVLDMNFAAGNGTTKSGLSFNMMSFGDGVRVVTEADRSILSSDAAVQELNQAILDELNLLANSKRSQ